MDGGKNKAINCSRNYSQIHQCYKGSDVYTCASDAEKQFDRINHYFLFYCMLLRYS